MAWHFLHFWDINYLSWTGMHGAHGMTCCAACLKAVTTKDNGVFAGARSTLLSVFRRLWMHRSSINQAIITVKQNKQQGGRNNLIFKQQA